MTLIREALVMPPGCRVSSVSVHAESWASYEAAVEAAAAPLRRDDVSVADIGDGYAYAYVQYDDPTGVAVLISSPSLEFAPDGSVLGSSLEPVA